MIAITLHQPFASLIAVKAKTIETRSWKLPEKYKGVPIAIHAAKRQFHLDTGSPVHKIITRIWGENAANTLPYGAVVAIATPVTSVQVERFTKMPNLDNYYTGDYSLKRWMWYLEDIKTVSPAIPARGYQGFWNWTPPTHFEEHYLT